MSNNKEIICLFERLHSRNVIKSVYKKTGKKKYRHRKISIDNERNKQDCAGDNCVIKYVAGNDHNGKYRNKIDIYLYDKKGVLFLTQTTKSESDLRTMNYNDLFDYAVTYKYNDTPKYTGQQNTLVPKSPYERTYIIENCCRSCEKPECMNPFMNPSVQASINECRKVAQKGRCCCACNSDAIFEVMKNLYECYKRKNCDNCQCIFCGCKEDAKEKKKKRKVKSEVFIMPLEDKTEKEKEAILKLMARQGIPLPEGKTKSDRKIIDKVRFELGMPPAPRTRSETKNMTKGYDAGIILPLNNKSPREKLKLLRQLQRNNIPLPVGRTASEQALIDKVKKEKKGLTMESVSQIPSAVLAAKLPSETIRKAKAAGLLTPLEGKSQAEKEKLLKAMARAGIPLPEGKTLLDEKIIDKVRLDLGMPPTPKTLPEKIKMQKGYKAGIVNPLDNHTAEEKENILNNLLDAGISMPVGRNPAEKALIEKVKNKKISSSESTIQIPSEVLAAKLPPEKIRKAKAAGLFTPLEDKTAKDKEKILKAMARMGIPLPYGKTPSEKGLIDKVRFDLGMPPTPETKAQKNKMAKAYEAGMVSPLNNKSNKQKEQVIRNLVEAGVPVPKGRTPSEQALIDKVLNETEGLGEESITQVPSEVIAAKLPPEKIQKAKAAGLFTPLQGKPAKDKEKILKAMARMGIPLPYGKTPSEKDLIDKVRFDLGMPPTPDTKAQKNKMNKAYEAGMVSPLNNKNKKQKEQVIRNLVGAGVPVPEGRTPSEQALIDKVLNETKGLPVESISQVPTEVLAAKLPPEKIRKAKAAGLFTPLEGKPAKDKEKILKAMARMGIPLPYGKTPSEKDLIDKVRFDLGMPPTPETKAQKNKMSKAYEAGVVSPLNNKNNKQKEQTIRNLIKAGVPAPKGRTPSEQALIDKVLNETEGLGEESITQIPSEVIAAKISPEKIRKAKVAGLFTPLEGKPAKDKEKILKAMARMGIPLPYGKTPSEKDLINKVRFDLRMPPTPETKSQKNKMAKAYEAGMVSPLNNKSNKQKEQVIRNLIEAGVPVPKGRTPSEQALIDKVQNETKGLPVESISQVPTEVLAAKLPPEKIRKAKAAGLFTPLESKPAKDKEKILKAMARMGIPLPYGKTPSEKDLIDKVRFDLGMPPTPETKDQKSKMAKAYEAGMVSPLNNKSDKQKEQVIRNLFEAGVPVPEGRTPSEQALIDKILNETKGLPVETISQVPTEVLAAKLPPEKIRKAKAAGLFTPLEGKPVKDKEKILKAMARMGIPLPYGKTPSEKDLIDKVRFDLGMPPTPETKAQKNKMAKAYEAGMVSPLNNKNNKQKEQTIRNLIEAGVPVPEGRTPSEQALIDKVLNETKGLPVETISQVPTEVLAAKLPPEKIRKAKAAGLFTPLEGKPIKDKEKILKAMARMGIPLPYGKTPSEKDLIDKVRFDLGMPPTPETKAQKNKMAKAYEAGMVSPLNNKNNKQKEQTIRNLIEAGVPVPAGRTPSEQALIDKVLNETKGLPVESISQVPTEVIAAKLPPEKIRKAKAAGLFTPLEGKPAKEKEKILKAMARMGIPLPYGKTPSEKDLIEKVRFDLGMPPTPETKDQKSKMAKAYAAGMISPLNNKNNKQKEQTIRNLIQADIPAPKGRTPSEQALIDKVLNEAKGLGEESITQLPSGVVPAKLSPEKMRKAKAAGLLTPLEGKTAKDKEKILKAMARMGIPLPYGKTPSEKDLIDKVRFDLGMPPTPETKAQKNKMANAYEAGMVSPLNNKNKKQKEQVIRNLVEAGVPVPEGRTPSEQALIDKVLSETKGLPVESISQVPTEVTAAKLPPEKIRKAKAAGLFTPLEGKPAKDKEKILKAMARMGIPLPYGKTPSEKDLIDKVRFDLGMPPTPKTKDQKSKMAKAYEAGMVSPLNNKNNKQKEQTIRNLIEAGVPVPAGRTPSEQALIDKVLNETKGLPVETISQVPTEVIAAKLPPEKIRKAKAAGLFTPLEGKPAKDKEKILKAMARMGIPLPYGKTPSEKDLIDKVRFDLGMPPTPETKDQKNKMAKAYEAGMISPLNNKNNKQKEQTLRNLIEAGVPVPAGRTPSEQALIDKVLNETKGLPVETISQVPTEVIAAKLPPEKIRKAKAAGLFTPLEGKPAKDKEKILKAMARMGIPLPYGKTPSEKDLIDKVRFDLGMPPTPETKDQKNKMAKAYEAGMISPLNNKNNKQKEQTLRNLIEAGIPVPAGRTPSEQALIDKVLNETKGLPVESISQVPTEVLAAKLPPEKIRKAKAAGLFTPLEGKPAKDKEKILKAMARMGIPLPYGKTPSEKDLIDKVRFDLGMPPTPETKDQKSKMAKAYEAGMISPLNNKNNKQKEQTLRNLIEAGIPAPAGRTPSEQALIDKVLNETKGLPVESLSQVPTEVLAAKLPPEKIRKAKAAGLFTPLEGKPAKDKEKILKALARMGIPLPYGKTPSEKDLIDKVKFELGMPPTPKTKDQKNKMAKAYEAGMVSPLNNKNNKQKEQTIRNLIEAGVPVPAGRTPSEQALIDKVLNETKGLPVETISQVPTEVIAAKLPPEKIRKAKAAGLFTPLEGKPAKDKEKILKTMARMGIPLPYGKTPSEKDLIDKVRFDLGMPPTPENKLQKNKMTKAYEAGLVSPLNNKSKKQKEQVIRNLIEAGVSVPEGRTPSERALIDKVQNETKGLPAESISQVPSADLSSKRPAGKIRKSKGLLTPLEGKSPAEKEKLLKAMARAGIPLPEGKTLLDEKIIDKVRLDLGMPPTPKTLPEKIKMQKGYKAGIVNPLDNHTPEEKENILNDLLDAGIPLPVGRNPAEKALIEKVKKIKSSLAESMPQVPPEVEAAKLPSELIRKAKEAGLFTPLEGKPDKDKEKILKSMARMGIPLPYGKTPSEKDLIDKVRFNLGMPPAPETKEQKIKMRKAYENGMVSPLNNKNSNQKGQVIKNLIRADVPVPEGRTPSEKALIDKVLKETKGSKEEPVSQIPSAVLEAKLPPEKMHQAETAGLFTPLEGKLTKDKEKVLRGMARMGIPLPYGKTPSEWDLIDKVRFDLGMPPTPQNKSQKNKMAKAYEDGKISPLDKKSPKKKEEVVKNLIEAGIPLPAGRTPSEKALIDRIVQETKGAPVKSASQAPSAILEETFLPEKIQKAKEAGLFTPLEGKSPEEKEKILRDLAKMGIPLPDGKSPSEKKLIRKVRNDLGLPPTPETEAQKIRMKKAYIAGIITPLDEKTPKQKEQVLKKLIVAGIPLPVGRTPSEEALIEKVKKDTKGTKGTEPMSLVPSAVRAPQIPSEKIRKAKAAGLFTPLEGKSPEEKEKLFRAMAKMGIPLPEGKTSSERGLINKVRYDLGLPPTPVTNSQKLKLAKAYTAGKVSPLNEKSVKQKEQILRNLNDAGIPLPEGRTPSEKALIDKIKKETKHIEPISQVSSTILAANIPPEKLQKAKAAGLLSPLEGKPAKDKEKILKAMARMGIPLPNGKTPSERDLIDKVRFDLGMPPTPETTSQKNKMTKGYEDGIISPLDNKSVQKKKEILENLLNAGIPLPKGRTASEIALINKVRGERDVKFSKSPASSLETLKRKVKCSRACGCDKKKIRFKHSYIKIRVTSPDISSFCDCPYKCLPVVEGGTRSFVDDEGIKLIIGRVSGAPSFAPSIGKNKNISKTKVESSSSQSEEQSVEDKAQNLKDEGWGNVIDLIFQKYYSSPHLKKSLVPEQGIKKEISCRINNIQHSSPMIRCSNDLDAKHSEFVTDSKTHSLSCSLSTGDSVISATNLSFSLSSKDSESTSTSYVSFLGSNTSFQSEKEDIEITSTKNSIQLKDESESENEPRLSLLSKERKLIENPHSRTIRDCYSDSKIILRYAGYLFKRIGKSKVKKLKKRVVINDKCEEILDLDEEQMPEEETPRSSLSSTFFIETPRQEKKTKFMTNRIKREISFDACSNVIKADQNAPINPINMVQKADQNVPSNPINIMQPEMNLKTEFLIRPLKATISQGVPSFPKIPVIGGVKFDYIPRDPTQANNNLIQGKETQMTDRKMQTLRLPSNNLSNILVSLSVDPEAGKNKTFVTKTVRKLGITCVDLGLDQSKIDCATNAVLQEGTLITQKEGMSPQLENCTVYPSRIPNVISHALQTSMFCGRPCLCSKTCKPQMTNATIQHTIANVSKCTSTICFKRPNLQMLNSVSTGRYNWIPHENSSDYVPVEYYGDPRWHHVQAERCYLTPFTIRPAPPPPPPFAFSATTKPLRCEKNVQSAIIPDFYEGKLVTGINRIPGLFEGNKQTYCESYQKPFQTEHVYYDKSQKKLGPVIGRPSVYQEYSDGGEDRVIQLPQSPFLSGSSYTWSTIHLSRVNLPFVYEAPVAPPNTRRPTISFSARNKMYDDDLEAFQRELERNLAKLEHVAFGDDTTTSRNESIETSCQGCQFPDKCKKYEQGAPSNTCSACTQAQMKGYERDFNRFGMGRFENEVGPRHNCNACSSPAKRYDMPPAYNTPQMDPTRYSAPAHLTERSYGGHQNYSYEDAGTIPPLPRSGMEYALSFCDQDNTSEFQCQNHLGFTQYYEQINNCTTCKPPPPRRPVRYTCCKKRSSCDVCKPSLPPQPLGYKCCEERENCKVCKTPPQPPEGFKCCEQTSSCETCKPVPVKPVEYACCEQTSECDICKYSPPPQEYTCCEEPSSCDTCKQVPEKPVEYTCCEQMTECNICRKSTPPLPPEYTCCEKSSSCDTCKPLPVKPVEYTCCEQTTECNICRMLPLPPVPPKHTCCDKVGGCDICRMPPPPVPPKHTCCDKEGSCDICRSVPPPIPPKHTCCDKEGSCDICRSVPPPVPPKHTCCDKEGGCDICRTPPPAPPKHTCCETEGDCAICKQRAAPVVYTCCGQTGSCTICSSNPTTSSNGQLPPQVFERARAVIKKVEEALKSLQNYSNTQFGQNMVTGMVPKMQPDIRYGMPTMVSQACQVCHCRGHCLAESKDSPICPCPHAECDCRSENSEDKICINGVEFTRSEYIQLKSNVTQSCSGFKMFKRRSNCIDMLTLEEAMALMSMTGDEDVSNFLKQYNIPELIKKQQLMPPEHRTDSPNFQQNFNASQRQRGHLGHTDTGYDDLTDTQYDEEENNQTQHTHHHGDELQKDNKSPRKTVIKGRFPQSYHPEPNVRPLEQAPSFFDAVHEDCSCLKMKAPVSRKPEHDILHKSCSCEPFEAEYDTGVDCECSPTEKEAGDTENKGVGEGKAEVDGGGEGKDSSKEQGGATAEEPEKENKKVTVVNKIKSRLSQGSMGGEAKPKIPRRDSKHTKRGIKRRQEPRPRNEAMEGETQTHTQNVYKVKFGTGEDCGPFGGMKLLIPGKGTRSTGLDGICCFNVSEYQGESSDSSEDSTYLIYTT